VGIRIELDSAMDLRKIQFKNIFISGMLLFFIIGCSDPVSKEEKEATVRTIIEGTLLEGTHIAFWDGKDNNKKSVSAGTYYVMLHTEELTYPFYQITALPGGTGQSNESSVKYIANHPGLTCIEYADPDTFYIEDGTNIHFSLEKDIGVRLTIRDRD
jgi:hypothetical protein